MDQFQGPRTAGAGRYRRQGKSRHRRRRRPGAAGRSHRRRRLFRPAAHRLRQHRRDRAGSHRAITTYSIAPVTGTSTGTGTAGPWERHHTGTTPGSIIGTTNTIGTTTDNFTAGLSASYGFDLWGLNQDKLRQARESLRAARYAETAVGLTTAASVANEYFTVLSFRERITIARQNIDAANRILAVTQAKVTNGVSSNLDLAQQQATVATQQARLPGLIESEREARYALAILLGRAPEGFDVKAQNLDGIVSPTVQPGLPSEVLLRRPDVAEAEANLYAAHANVDAARAAFFPAIGLTGSAGYASAAHRRPDQSGEFRLEHRRLAGADHL